jgi:hypothetical protein
MDKISTYQVKNYLGESYDSSIPNDLAEAFVNLTKKLSDVSNGKYEATLIYDQSEPLAITSAIIEHKETHQTKTRFKITIEKFKNNE